MPHRIRTLVLVGVAITSASLLSGCSSSGSDSGAPTTTPPSTTIISSTIADVPSTTEAGTSKGAIDCQALLQEYADRFTMDDLSDASAFFREYATSMPTEVGDAVVRIADAYDEAEGDPANLDFGDVDLTADAQTFSDWTNDGCPAE